MAAYAGAEELIILIPDRELGIVLPAPGFQQTLPDPKRWREFLDRCREKSFHADELSYPAAGSIMSARGFAAADGSIAVFLGGDHLMDEATDIALLLPIVASAFEGERVAAVSQANTTLAKQAATQAKLLADSLDKARNELRQTLAEARRANAAKDRFLAVLSHELRTPLNPVLMAASAMETDQALPPEIRADISMIRRNVELEARLIDDLLDLTRIANGKVQLQRKIVDAHELLQEATVVVQADASSFQPEIILDLAATEHFIDGDAARIQQVFWNLIRNAVKFTALDGRVAVRTSNPGAGLLRIEVIDTGIGITPQALAKIFNAFEQAEPEINHHFGGLGLGLAISKTLAEMHGGRLRAESAGLGKGASFIFELPAAVADAAAVETEIQLPAGSRPKSILLVEDHLTTAALMARLLRKRGHEVVVAHTKADAIAAGRGQTFDVVISDMGLPDGSGYEVMEALRADSAIVGIALTGYGMEADVALSAKAGFQFHLIKPIDAQKLYQTIEQIAPQAQQGSRTWTGGHGTEP